MDLIGITILPIAAVYRIFFDSTVTKRWEHKKKGKITLLKRWSSRNYRVTFFWRGKVEAKPSTKQQQCINLFVRVKAASHYPHNLLNRANQAATPQFLPSPPPAAATHLIFGKHHPEAHKEKEHHSAKQAPYQHSAKETVYG